MSRRRPAPPPQDVDQLGELENRLIAYYEEQFAARQRAGKLGRRIMWLGGILAVLALFACGGMLPALFTDAGTGGSEQQAHQCGGDVINVDAKSAQVQGLASEQVTSAVVIVQIGKDLQISPRGWVIATATAMQESNLKNLPNLGARNDHDSVGLFQQRPSQGWGSEIQLRDPRYSATKFYQKLQTVAGWEQMRLTDAAQAVQRSAFPGAYQKWEPLATRLVNVITNGGGFAAANAEGKSPSCAQPGEISAAGWAAPVVARLSSGFRTADRPDHDGADLAAPRGSDIHAAAAGIVITAKCNVSAGSCDQDGGLQIKGCGWYVEIDHGGGVVTRYCHMQRQPAVKAGDRVVAGSVIGQVGASGNADGPHLHFEVHVNGRPVDPVEFMRGRGATLGEKT